MGRFVLPSDRYQDYQGYDHVPFPSDLGGRRKVERVCAKRRVEVVVRGAESLDRTEDGGDGEYGQQAGAAGKDERQRFTEACQG